MHKSVAIHTYRFFSFSEEDKQSKPSFQEHGDRDFKKIRIAAKRMHLKTHSLDHSERGESKTYLLNRSERAIKILKNQDRRGIAILREGMVAAAGGAAEAGICITTKELIPYTIKAVVLRDSMVPADATQPAPITRRVIRAMLSMGATRRTIRCPLRFLLTTNEEKQWIFMKE